MITPVAGWSIRQDPYPVELESLRGVVFDDSCIDCPALVRTLYEIYGISVPLVSGDRKVFAENVGDELYSFVDNEGNQIHYPGEKLPEGFEIVCNRFTIEP